MKKFKRLEDEALGTIRRCKNIDIQRFEPAEPVESAKDFLQSSFATRDVI